MWYILKRRVPPAVAITDCCKARRIGQLPLRAFSVMGEVPLTGKVQSARRWTFFYVAFWNLRVV